MSHVPIELRVELGRKRVTLGQALAVRPGQVVPLDRLATEPADLLAEGKLIAHGEIVVIDEEFGIQISDVIAGSEAVTQTEGSHPDDQRHERMDPLLGAEAMFDLDDSPVASRAKTAQSHSD